MAKTKKKEALSLEEKLEQALVPVDEQPYEVPENWCWVTVGNMVDLHRGVSYKKNEAHSVKKENDCLVMRGGNILEGAIDVNADNIYVDKSLVKPEQYVKENDVIIVSSTGSTKVIGRAGISHEDYEDVSFGTFLTLVRPKEQTCKRYVDYYFHSQIYRERIRSLASGVNINNIRSEHITNAPMPLPSLAEQQRIVEQIESLFAKLDGAKEKVQAVADGYEDRVNAIYNAAFKGDYTASWRKQKGITMDETWERVISQDVCEPITCGKTPKEHITNSGEIPYLKVYNIVDNRIDFVKTPQFIPRDIHEGKLKSSMLKSGDVIMNIVGPPLRKVAIIPEDYPEWNMNQAIVRFRPKKNKILSKYLYYALLNPETLEEVISQTRGVVGQANISVSQSRNLELPCPLLEEQQEIAKILDSLLYKEKVVLEKANNIMDLIDTMKKSVLADAFRGKLGTNMLSEESSVNLLRNILLEEEA